MAVVDGTAKTVHLMEGTAWSGNPVYEITFELAGTYAQADNARLANLAQIIQTSCRHGRTVTPRAAMMCRAATKDSDKTELTMKNVALAGGHATFEVAGPDYTTELADGAVPALDRPFSILVLCTEA